jgi:hypothetical protein
LVVGFGEAVCMLSPVSKVDLVLESGVVSHLCTIEDWMLCHPLPLLLLKGFSSM